MNHSESMAVRGMTASASMRSALQLDSSLEFHDPPAPAPRCAAAEALPPVADEALEKNSELFRQLIDQSSDAIFVVDPANARILDVNQRACVSLGYSYAELRSLTMMQIEAAYDDFSWPEQVAKARAGELETLETGQRRKDGEIFLVEVSLKHVEVDGRAYVVAAARDITEKKQLEAKYLRAQRLESIGRLAGGIAHDLNNVLSPILLSIQLLRQRMSDPGTKEILDLVEGSARRGAGMIRQVLTFAEGAKGERAPVNFCALLQELVRMGCETFPRSIQIKSAIPPNLWPAVGDATQLHQVLLNLCLNACEAMPQGGLLELRAENRQVDEKQARAQLNARPGPHVVLSIRDNGTGIDPGLIEKIFEPFFTTKAPGKGTGLGLAIVLGIVQAHGGFMAVESRPQQGSCFQVFLPAKPDRTSLLVDRAIAARSPADRATILVVDDEEPIRRLTGTILLANGYEVLTATDGAAAVAVYQERQKEIRAVIMDLAMPYMDGAAAMTAILKIDPAARFLVVSGMMDPQRFPVLASESPLALLAKPYGPEQLLKSLAAVLGPDAGPSAKSQN